MLIASREEGHEHRSWVQVSALPQTGTIFGQVNPNPKKYSSHLTPTDISGMGL